MLINNVDIKGPKFMAAKTVLRVVTKILKTTQKKRENKKRNKKKKVCENHNCSSKNTEQREQKDRRREKERRRKPVCKSVHLDGNEPGATLSTRPAGKGTADGPLGGTDGANAHV